METNQEPTLEQRVERLENLVEQILHHSKQQNKPAPSQKPAVPTPTASKLQQIKAAQTASSPTASTVSQVTTWFSSENWLNKIGIALLLFGLVFLFKFSIDQGWITPPIRVGFGLAVGVILLVSGFLLKQDRQALKSVLLGGGIAAFYISAYAAFQFYQLVPHVVAFAFMVLVTLLTFFLALRGKNFVLALIGAIGGLITPLILSTGDGSIPGLIGYTCLILLGTIIIYFFTGWRTLLAVSTFGGWSILIVGLVEMDSDGDRIAVHLGVLFAWIAFWGMPTVREWLAARSPQRWQPLVQQATPKSLVPLVDFYHQAQPHLLVWVIPLMTFAASNSIEYFNWSGQTWGIIALGFALIYAIAAYFLQGSEKTRVLSVSHILVAAVFAGIGWLMLFVEDHPNITFLLFIFEGLLLQFIALKLSSTYMRISSVVYWGFMGLVLWGRFLEPSPSALLHGDNLTNLIAIAAIFGISYYSAWPNLKIVFRLAAHIFFLAWMWHIMGEQNNGTAYTSVMWGGYAIVLLVWALVQRLSTLRKVAMATIFLVVAKLFLVDLAELPAIWRILLFMGFGVIFLILSYFLPRMIKSEEKS